MPNTYIPTHEMRFLSSLMCDYIASPHKLASFFERLPQKDQFQKQIDVKKANYNKVHRKVLVGQLQLQYLPLITDSEWDLEMVIGNISSLADENTFTITTGHQLNLFTGPLYFIYKIIHTIRMCRELQEAYPNYNFVPIYWMASEDHDFQEINYCNLNGTKISWEKPEAITNAYGAVGELELADFESVAMLFETTLGQSKTAKDLVAIFKDAYLNSKDLAEATFKIVNRLFSAYGLVVIEPNVTAFKQTFVSTMLEDLKCQHSYYKVTETSQLLKEQDYKVQVTPREINLFYKTEYLRKRIVKQGQGYAVIDTDISWQTYEGIKSEMQEYPERFSPNVLLRPVYQEVLLPNLCYIGGGGELAYWLQLKSTFEALKVSFPILKLRNSVLLVTQKQANKLAKLGVSYKELSQKKLDLENEVTHKLTKFPIDLSLQKKQLEQIFDQFRILAKRTDISFEASVKAAEAQQKKAVDKLEKRLLKAQKRKLKDHLERVGLLQDELYPNQSLQERQVNFGSFYVDTQGELIERLLKDLPAFGDDFVVVEV